MIAELTKKYPSLKLIKAFPESGQKWVFLVKVDPYGVVILKIIKKMDDRIRREIDIVNQNNIPGVPKVMEMSTLNYNGEEYHYLFEEYIEGEALSEVLKRGPMPVKNCLTLLENLLTAVVTLEELGIVHRDIKPDNIICASDGTFRLIDFGIARNLNLPSLTMTAVAFGPHTPGYGAPELFQYSKSKINSRADLFSIGVVVYQAVFGKHPFLTGKEVELDEIWYRTATVIPKIQHIPGDRDGQLFALIQTMMQKQVSKRPPSAKRALEWYRIVLGTLSL